MQRGCGGMQSHAEGCTTLGGCTGSCRWMLSHQWHAAKEGFNPGTQNRVLAAAALRPQARGRAQAGQATSYRLGCETAAHGRPRSGVLRSHAPSSEAVGGGDAARGTEGQAAGAHGRGGGIQRQHTPRILKLKSYRPVSAQRGGTNRPQVLLTSLSRAHQGGNCKSPAAIYRGRFPLQNPDSRRAGLGASLQGPCSATLKQHRRCRNHRFLCHRL